MFTEYIPKITLWDRITNATSHSFHSLSVQIVQDDSMLRIHSVLLLTLFFFGQKSRHRKLGPFINQSRQ